MFTSNFIKRNSGFTLAEVLITLGIIGIVATMTIPNLITNYKAKRLHTQFLKSYSVLQQAFKIMENDDITIEPRKYGSPENNPEFFYKTFMNYLQAPIDCGTTDYGNSNSLPCFPFRHNDDDKKTAYKSYDGKSLVSVYWLDDGEIALQDGTLLLFENYDRIWISVDLNGYNNPPNRLGYDLFTFQFIDGELKTMGDRDTDYTDMNKYCNPKITNSLNGITCAQKAKEDTDYFKKLVNEFK